MKNLKLISIFLLLGLSLPISTVAAFQVNEQTSDMILEGIDARKALSIANQWRWTQKEITSYVDTREVVFKFPNGNITKIPLPKDEIMVAVAPYIKNTHEWTVHYISSCQGELPNRAFKVRAVDEEGRIIINKTISTLRNGFFELWLPKDRRFELTFQGMNRKAKGIIETFENSKTCVTTFQLR